MINLRSVVTAFLLATAVGACAQKAPSSARPRTATDSVKNEHFTLPLPAGYDDVSADFQPQLSAVLKAKQLNRGYQATIVVRRVPIPGGTFADPATCARTGTGVVMGGTEAPGTGGTLLSAAIIDGPVGKTCQIHVRAPEGIALITELHGPGNTPQTPQDIWLMICNHADGDEEAEATCRSTLAGFRFRSR